MDLVTSGFPMYPGWQNLQTLVKSTGQEDGMDLTAKTWTQVMVYKEGITIVFSVLRECI